MNTEEVYMLLEAYENSLKHPKLNFIRAELEKRLAKINDQLAPKEDPKPRPVVEEASSRPRPVARAIPADEVDRRV